MPNITHGHAKDHTPTYRAWVNMRSRCKYPSVDNYPNYGGRGIKVCKRWGKFENFLADMGVRPEGKTLERLDSNGDYTPKNCRWATALEQAANTRNNLRITHQGRTQHLAAWAREVGIPYSALYYRIFEAGWAVSQALSFPSLKSMKKTWRKA